MPTITIVARAVGYGVVGFLFGLVWVWAQRRWPKTFRSDHDLKYHPEKITYPGDPLTDGEIGLAFACILIWLPVAVLVVLVLVVYWVWSTFTSFVRPPLNWLFRRIK